MGVVMPRVNIIPNVETGTINVDLTNPTPINAGNPSAFPMDEDIFKILGYESASSSQVKTKLKEYYATLSSILGGDNSAATIDKLEVLTGQIKDYVLTDEDYSLMVGALKNVETYILKFMYTDITNKAKAMDTELNLVIADINRFMLDLEATYSKSPSSYPIPDGSVLRPKLQQDVQDTLAYTDATEGVVISTTKPANPVGRGLVWFNTGAKI